jgi:ADP-heptose:LPS heptosyltransferase
VTPSAVIQVKPGIGDVIWHLPFIRAIAAATPCGQVTFFVAPTSGASVQFRPGMLKIKRRRDGRLGLEQFSAAPI